METGADKETKGDKEGNTERAQRQSLIRPPLQSERERGPSVNNAVGFAFITTDPPVWPPNLCHRQYVSQLWRHPVRPGDPSLLKSVSQSVQPCQNQIIHFLKSRYIRGDLVFIVLCYTIAGIGTMLHQQQRGARHDPPPSKSESTQEFQVSLLPWPVHFSLIWIQVGTRNDWKAGKPELGRSIC